MSTISGFPIGFLSLLESKTFGNNPNQVGDVLLPTVDIGDLFLTTKQTAHVQGVAAPANGPNAGIFVPPGEVWRIHAGGMFAICPVGATIDATLVVEQNSGVLPLSDTLVIAPNTTRWLSMKSPAFWLQAGAQFSVYITSLAGAPTVSLGILVSKLKS